MMQNIARLLAIGGLAVAFSGPAKAQMLDVRLVTNTAMCDLGPDEYSGELGMELNEQGFYEIEYNCEFDSPVTYDWTGDYTAIVRAGYCAEPGFISPTVFVVQMSVYEPDTVYVWQQGRDEAITFTSCGRG